MTKLLMYIGPIDVRPDLAHPTVPLVIGKTYTYAGPGCCNARLLLKESALIVMPGRKGRCKYCGVLVKEGDTAGYLRRKFIEINDPDHKERIYKARRIPNKPEVAIFKD